MNPHDTSAGSQPLQSLRILDFSRVLAGPYCTAMMADLGAEVIKVESSLGDDYRHIGPFKDDESLLFQSVNRGKKSIVLDLKSEAGVEQARQLAGECDVLVENFRPGVMQRLGLGPDELREQFPQLIYVSVSGFGQSGPNESLPAYDIIIQAMSGLMDVTGEADGSPMMVGDAIADVAGGMFAAFGTMVALFQRNQTGNGSHVDLALYDSLLAMMPIVACRVLMAGQSPTRTGNRHALSAPFGSYQAKDGYFTVAVLNDRLFKSFAEVLGQPELTEDPRFTSDELRRANEPALATIIESWAQSHNAESVVEQLSNAGIPASLLQTAQQAWASPQAKVRQLAPPVQHPVLGELLIPEQPVHFSDTSRGHRKAAPELGADTDDILATLKTGASS